MAALVVGLVAADLFLVQRQWQHPLTVATAAVLVLMILTIVQPLIWLRLLLDTLLLVGLW